VVLALCAWALLALQDATPGIDWPAVWARLAQVRGVAEDARDETVIDSLRAVAREQRETPRGAMLAAHLDRLEEGEGTLTLPAGAAAAWPFRGPENWLAAEVLAPSALRARAIQDALEATDAALDSRQRRLAWEVGVDEARALRLDGARSIQEELHRRSLAVWSAMDLSLTLSRLGLAEAADRVLAEQIEREAAAGRDTGDLWSRRGTQTLGNGDEARARDYLGHGLARGSADAGVVLARLDLESGRIAEARAGFRALLLDPAPSPWAARGWGLTLLPPPSTDRTAEAGERE